MKLYYVIDKWKVNKTNIIVPFYYKGDCYDNECRGNAYYRAMRYLRDAYNVDPERSRYD